MAWDAIHAPAAHNVDRTNWHLGVSSVRLWVYYILLWLDAVSRQFKPYPCRRCVCIGLGGALVV